ncbi:hypothetical protein [Neobacillus notoginsengisoli]|uniref:hypothetical protein n=1 Tax=Neobacillus notoginsengisoli TaxID=1578198 RepID=UPI001314920A|nr:hypothetical protein [Neobacillus notoginsengisoli]
MELLTNLLQLPSLWLIVIGVIALIFVIKVIRSVIGAVVSLAFTVLGFYRVFLFLQDKL